jgi:hypothetical protein
LKKTKVEDVTRKTVKLDRLAPVLDLVEDRIPASLRRPILLHLPDRETQIDRKASLSPF